MNESAHSGTYEHEGPRPGPERARLDVELSGEHLAPTREAPRPVDEPLGVVVRFNGDLHAFQSGAASPLLFFAMCRAFPGSDYYESSAPTRRDQPTLSLAQGRRRTGSHVHCRSVGGLGAQLFPCGPGAPVPQRPTRSPDHGRETRAS